MPNNVPPGLFGLVNSNRDFTSRQSWGKNQFNSSFPAALLCYMGVQGVEPVYLQLGSDLHIYKSHRNATQLLGLPPLHEDLHFSFEEAFTPYADLVIGALPRADLITRNLRSPYKDCLRAYEVKLTALPDNTTHDLPEDRYGSEIVVRPDTIVYIALSVARYFSDKREQLELLLAPAVSDLDTWVDVEELRLRMAAIIDAVNRVFLTNLEAQEPLLLQPLWKTKGKLSTLAEDCFDIFVWSTYAVTRLFMDIAVGVKGKFSRHERSVIWLMKMLYDFALTGKIDFRRIISNLAFDVRNDKAFAISGRRSYFYMQSAELTHPRIPKYAVRNIILGDGQKYLSPERRLDATILSTPDLFREDEL